MHRKFLAIFMTVCLVAALFAGCGGKDKGDSSTKPDISSPSTQENGTAADANAVIPGETQHADGQSGTEQTANGSGSNTANTPGGGSNGTTGKTAVPGRLQRKNLPAAPQRLRQSPPAAVLPIKIARQRSFRILTRRQIR